MNYKAPADMKVWSKFGYKSPVEKELGKPSRPAERGCFGYLQEDDKKETCAALNKLYCKYEKCAFYKPYEQYQKEVQEEMKRRG